MQVYTLSFLLFLQAFSTGQLEQAKALPSTAQAAVTSIAAKQENDPISARNIILQSVDGGQT